MHAVAVYWPEAQTVQVSHVPASETVEYVEPATQSVQTASVVELQEDVLDFPASHVVHSCEVLVLQNEFTGHATGAAAPPAHV